MTPPTDIDSAGMRSSKRIRTAGIRTAGIRPRVVLGWVGAVAFVVAGGTLATVTFARGDDGRAEVPSGQAATRMPACVWTSQVDVPFFPRENLGPAPTSDSVLVFERCDGEWTGDIAWLESGDELAPLGDDGMPNP
jgi:hypothetical protein